MELFRRGGDARLSTRGAMACAGCHAEGRTDGLSWRIQGQALQTPILAGRLLDTHPFKWDGKDPTLDTSLRNTVTRLGGRGITVQEAADLQAFLLALAPPRPPTVQDPRLAAEGKRLFHDGTTGCDSCHSGPSLADGASYDLDTELGETDTPALVGLAHSAPYYHDGSARTLRSLLVENGRVHGMGETGHLDDHQIDALVAYLRTL